MTEHLPECELTEPCGLDTPKHGFCSRQSTFCIHCERACLCERLRACEIRSLDAAVQRVQAMPWDYTDACGELIPRAKAIAAIKRDQP